MDAAADGGPDKTMDDEDYMDGFLIRASAAAMIAVGVAAKIAVGVAATIVANVDALTVATALELAKKKTQD